MIHVVLFEPEIPPNTGNVARTCAATGTPLHLVEPLGFSISDKHVRRAGLDYWESLDLTVHSDWPALITRIGSGRFVLLSTRGTRLYTEIFTNESGRAKNSASGNGNLFVVFGPETRGLPKEILDAFPEAIFRVPMRATQRSLNLSNTVAVVLYELLRREGFPHLA